MRIKTFTSLILLLVNTYAYSAEITELNQNRNPNKLPALTVGYFGEMFSHPGMMVGAEFTIVGNQNHQLLGTLNVGWYVHRRNYHALFLNSEIGYRYTFNVGFNIHTLLGVGYFHKFADGTIYEVRNDTLKEVRNTGRPRFMPSFSLGLGWDFRKKTNLPFGLFTRVQVFGEYPDDSFFMPHAALLIGANYYF